MYTTCTTMDHIYTIDPVSHTVALGTPCLCGRRAWGQPGTRALLQPASDGHLRAQDAPTAAIVEAPKVSSPPAPVVEAVAAAATPDGQPASLPV